MEGESIFPFHYMTCISKKDSSRPIEQDAETMRLQILGDPRLMAQLQEVPFHTFHFQWKLYISFSKKAIFLFRHNPN